MALPAGSELMVTRRDGNGYQPFRLGHACCRVGKLESVEVLRCQLVPSMPADPVVWAAVQVPGQLAVRWTHHAPTAPAAEPAGLGGANRCRLR
jgi:hypothetical protein